MGGQAEPDPPECERWYRTEKRPVKLARERSAMIYFCNIFFADLS